MSVCHIRGLKVHTSGRCDMAYVLSTHGAGFRQQLSYVPFDSAALPPAWLQGW